MIMQLMATQFGAGFITGVFLVLLLIFVRKVL
jgi:hypothetical protein